MHELTLLFGVADKIGQVTKENNIDHVEAVVLEIGEATAIVPEFLLDGYEVISDEYDFLRGSELIIEKVISYGRCRDCGCEFPIARNKGCCPECGSFDKEILTGQDFIIKEIRVLDQ